MATIRLDFEEGKELDLPPVCALCGLPATEVQARQFRWTPPWANAAGILLGSWVAVVGTLTREVALPLCAEHADRRRDWEARRRQYLLLYMPVVVALVLVLVAKVLYQGLDAVLREGPVVGLGLPLLAAVLVFLVTWPFVVTGAVRRLLTHAKTRPTGWPPCGTAPAGGRPRPRRPPPSASPPPSAAAPPAGTPPPPARCRSATPGPRRAGSPSAAPGSARSPPAPAAPPAAPRTSRCRPAPPGPPAPPPAPEPKKEADKPAPQQAAAAFGEVRRFEGHGGQVFGVAVSPDGKLALSGCADSVVRLWEVATGKELRRFEGHKGWAVGGAFLPDGKHALSCGNDKTVRLWDVETGKELRKLEGHTSVVWTVAISADGKRALSGSHDRTVRLWDLDAGKELKKFEGYPGAVWWVALSPDGKRALSGGDAYTDTDGKRVADPDVRVLNVETGKELGRLIGHRSAPVTVAFSPDGKRALTGGFDNILRLWDVETGKELRQFLGHNACVRCVAFSPDGRRAVTGGYDNTVRLWDLDSGKEIGRFDGHNELRKTDGMANYLFGVAFTPDGRQVMSASGDHTLRLLDTQALVAKGVPDKPPPKPAMAANLTLPEKLDSPIDFPGIDGPSTTIGDMLGFLSARYTLKIQVDNADFKKNAPNDPDILKQHVRLPQLRRIKLGTVMELLLSGVRVADDQLQATYVVQGNQLLIVSTKLRLPRDESRTSPLTKKLGEAVTLPKELDPKTTVAEMLEYLHDRTGLTFVVQPRWAGSGETNIREKPVKLAGKPPATLGAALKQLLEPAGATYIIRSDHILIVPKEAAGSSLP